MRPGRRARWTCLLATAFFLAIGAAPAQAATGGASASDGTTAGAGLSFTAMRVAGATWYGPGLYGNHTACGETLTPKILGVAHKTLPCGTTVKLAYHGHYLVTKVIDRGPYSPGNAFDLTNGARLRLEFSGADRVRYAVAAQHARHHGS
jgi:rare lipoprotein A (peptidoglycan hydrolase)